MYKDDVIDSKKGVRGEVNSDANQASQTGSVSPPTPSSDPHEVGREI